MAFTVIKDTHIHADIEAMLDGLVARTILATPKFMLFEVASPEGLSQAQKLLRSCDLAFHEGTGHPMAAPKLHVLHVLLPTA